MSKPNYDKKMMEIIQNHANQENKPTLLLHVCCAPCSSATLERLVEHFDITVFFYNPNIAPKEEFDKRIVELNRFLHDYEDLGEHILEHINVITGSYDYSEFLSAIKGLEDTGERGERCYKCYELRLKETVKLAKQKGFDYFTTTLSISPHKNVNWLNEIGEQLSKDYNISYLYSDFKKQNGYKRSIELSETYHLYRQNYCGCAFSKRERELQR